MKGFLQFIIVALFILATFFGVGPILMADGSMQERLITLGLVVLIYIVLFLLFGAVSRRK